MLEPSISVCVFFVAIVLQIVKKTTRDKWRSKGGYTIVSPSYFSNRELDPIPTTEPDGVIGRVVESTLYGVHARWRRNAIG